MWRVSVYCLCLHAFLGIVSVVCSAHHGVTAKFKLLAESRYNLRCIYVASRIYFHWPTSENRQRRSNKKLRNGTDGLQYAIHRQDYWIIELLNDKINPYDIWNNWDFLYISTPSLNNTGLSVSGLICTYGFEQAFKYETNCFN